MNIHSNNTEKHEYIAPSILVINLDNDISLQLESSPPVFENEGLTAVPEFFKQNPFHSQNS